MPELPLATVPRRRWEERGTDKDCSQEGHRASLGTWHQVAGAGVLGGPAVPYMALPICLPSPHPIPLPSVPYVGLSWIPSGILKG